MDKRTLACRGQSDPRAGINLYLRLEPGLGEGSRKGLWLTAPGPTLQLDAGPLQLGLSRDGKAEAEGQHRA